MDTFTTLLQGLIVPMARRGGLGRIVGWFIRVVIYDIIVTSISSVFGVSRLVACFIFLGGLMVVGVGGYAVKQKMGKGVDE